MPIQIKSGEASLLCDDSKHIIVEFNKQESCSHTPQQLEKILRDYWKQQDEKGLVVKK
jgi:hypothetical protein